jgi:predicted aspartyl protease
MYVRRGGVIAWAAGAAISVISATSLIAMPLVAMTGCTGSASTPTQRGKGDGPASASGSASAPAQATTTRGEATEPTSAKDVIAAVRTAMNYKAFAATSTGLMMHGEVDVYGTKGPVSFLFSPAGEFLMQMQGPLGRTDGFDGTTAWERTESGIGRVLPLTDRDVRLTSYEFRTMQWLSEKSALAFEMAPTKGETIELSFTRPGTSIHGTVSIDRKTNLPRGYVIVGDGETDTHTLSDYQAFEGVQIARHVESRTEHASIVMDITEVKRAPTFIRNPYETVLSLPSDFKFDPAVSAAINVQKAPTLHHLVKVKVGEEEGWFIFDSGAGTEVLSTQFAEKLKLEKFGKIPVRGVGGVVESGFYQPSSLTVGPLTIEKPILVGLDLSMLDQYMGVPVAGIVGYGVLGRSVAVIDEVASTIELHDSRSFELKNGEWTEVLLYGRHPAVKGSLEGHEGYFRLDTGAANTTITVHAPTVAEFNMLDDRPVTNTMLGGVGGMIEARAGVLKSLTLGGKTFKNIQASLALPGDGAMDDAGTMGNVGGLLLKPFVLVFDYPNHRMAFIPRVDADETIKSLEHPAK